MKELIDKLIGAVPLFGRLMVALLRAPKTTILQMDLESDSALTQAFTFLAVSFGFAFLGQIFLLPEKSEKEVLFGVLAVQSVLGFGLNVVLVVVAWRLAGAKPAWRKIVAASCYFAGVSTVIFLAFSLVAAGAFKMLDPVGFQQTMTSSVTDFAELMESGGFRIFTALLTAGMVAALIWIVVIWGAYREMMQVSRTRSAIALLLFILISPVLLAVQSMMTFTIAMTRSTPPVPSELVGVWSAGAAGSQNGMPTVEAITFVFAAPRYRFFPLGDYAMNDILQSNHGKCIVARTRQEQGRLAVEGSTIKLIPQTRTESNDDQCTGKKWESPTDLSKGEYQYQINKQAAGWTLCLSNRFGHICLLPKLMHK